MVEVFEFMLAKITAENEEDGFVQYSDYARLAAELAKIREIIPQTYGEAIVKYNFLKCESHEWDNHTTVEALFFLVGAFQAELANAITDKEMGRVLVDGLKAEVEKLRAERDKFKKRNQLLESYFKSYSLDGKIELDSQDETNF